MEINHFENTKQLFLTPEYESLKRVFFEII